MDGGHHKGRQTLAPWPGPDNTQGALPSTLASPVPACRQEGPAVHREGTSCTLPTLSPARQPFPTGHAPTHLPSSPRPGHLHSADIGKGWKHEGFRGGKEELGHSSMRHTASGAASLPDAAPHLSRHWVGELYSRRRAVSPPTHRVNHLQTPCAHSEANGKTLPKDTHDLGGGIVARIWQRQEAAPTVVRHNSGEQERRA